MYDSDYDRQIVKQVEAINRRFIAHQRAVGRARMVNGGADYSSGLGMEGGSFLDKIPLVGNVAHLFGLGETGVGMEGGSFLDKIPLVGNVAHLFGLGETGGRKKRVYKKKGGAELEMEGGRKKLGRAITGSAETGGRKKLGRAITGAAETGAGRKKRVYKKKGGAELLNMVDKSGGSFLDNIPIAGNIAKMLGLGETGAGRKKVHRKGKGVEDALEGMGSKAGAKKNPWVAHVKAVAAKKGISYREALKVAKASY